jgi:hypothetical protein
VAGDPLTSAFSRGSVETSICGEANDIGEMSYHAARVRGGRRVRSYFADRDLLILALTACYLLSCGTRPFRMEKSRHYPHRESGVLAFVWVRSRRFRFAAPAAAAVIQSTREEWYIDHGAWSISLGQHCASVTSSEQDSIFHSRSCPADSRNRHHKRSPTRATHSRARPHRKSTVVVNSVPISVGRLPMEKQC